MILLYTQPSNFSPPADLSQPGVGVSVFSLSDYVSTSGLQGPVAGMYFTVEEGTATVSVSSTSAVQTSTLPIPSSSATGSATGSATHATATGNGAVALSQFKNIGTGALAGLLAGILWGEKCISVK